MAERSDGASDEPRDGASNGSVRSKGRGSGAFTARTDYAPDDLVAIKVRFANRKRFNDWYADLYPGVEMLPARDAWVDRVFGLGLDQIEKMMPAQPSPEDRWTKALEGRP